MFLQVKLALCSLAMCHHVPVVKLAFRADPDFLQKLLQRVFRGTLAAASPHRYSNHNARLTCKKDATLSAKTRLFAKRHFQRCDRGRGNRLRAFLLQPFLWTQSVTTLDQQTLEPTVVLRDMAPSQTKSGELRLWERWRRLVRGGNSRGAAKPSRLGPQ